MHLPSLCQAEMLLNVALIVQRFQVEMADPTYDISKLARSSTAYCTDNQGR